MPKRHRSGVAAAICAYRYTRGAPEQREASMSTMEILVREDALVETMSAMRQWLDRHRVEPRTFHYAFGSPDVRMRIDFNRETDATEFAAAFGGRVLAAPRPAEPERQRSAPRPSR
jgi:hypothetical protein